MICAECGFMIATRCGCGAHADCSGGFPVCTQDGNHAQDSATTMRPRCLCNVWILVELPAMRP